MFIFPMCGLDTTFSSKLFPPTHQGIQIKVNNVHVSEQMIKTLIVSGLKRKSVLFFHAGPHTLATLVDVTLKVLLFVSDSGAAAHSTAL